MKMRIPYLNLPCLINKTCFHGQCQHVQDVLTGWYEFCLCEPSYVGLECAERKTIGRTDWLILLLALFSFLAMIFCCVTIPFFYYVLKDDFYPQIIECARSTPYVEIQPFSNTRSLPDIRLYRIPSEYLSRRRTILDGLVPLHSISSWTYLTDMRHLTTPRQRTI